jgi:anaerobic selenocysteine-containing dehydrogenase/ferredoxin-NADP reductase
MASSTGIERKAGFCALCRSRCGAQYLVQDGRMVGVEPLGEHPTGGALCAKGRAAPEILYHPQRLRQPLRRTRPREDPEPGWVEVSWDEALDDIAARLVSIRRESGAHAVAFSSASPGATALSDSLDWIERLIFSFGSPNFLTGVEICNWHRDHGHAFTFGSGIGMPDYAQSDLVILWGFNPGNVWLAQAQAISAARACGARLLVVDPARTHHARDADLWLRVSPGSDAALALGLARWLIHNGQFDVDFVRCWSNAPFLVCDDTGRMLTERDLDPAAPTNHPLAWDLQASAVLPVDTRTPLSTSQGATLALQGRFQLAGAQGPVHCRPAFAHHVQACDPYTPEHVQEDTGIPAAQVVQAAQAIAAARRVSYFCWTGISQHVGSSQADRAIALLYALTGCVDGPGGNLHLVRQPVNRPNDRRLLTPEQAGKALGLAQRPLGPPAFGWTLGRDFHDAVLTGQPYKVRALVGFGANLLMSQADTGRARAALQALDFQVHCDLFETPTARHADYLLPVNTPWEREALRIGFEISAEAEEHIQLRQPIVAQQADNAARSDLDIVFALATRLGLGDHFFNGDVQAGWNHVLEPLGLTVDQLRAHPGGLRVPVAQAMRKYADILPDGTVRGFATPSRRVEFYSTQFHGHGYAPVPFAQDPLAAVALDAAERSGFPLTLSCAKSGYFCQSQHRALASLRRREPEPHVRLHPELADTRGIHDGDWCLVHTRNGQARYRARLDDALAPQVVMASFGWWQACEDLGLVGGDPLAPRNSHFNGLISTEYLDDVSGAIALRAFPCDITQDASSVRTWAGWKAFEVRAMEPAGGDVSVLELAAQDGCLLPDYLCGQHVPLALEADGVRLERSYSLIGATRVQGHDVYRIAVKRSAAREGVSHRLHAAGAEPVWAGGRAPRLWLKAPRGHFLLPLQRSTPVVLMAAGVGITPFVGMLETLAASPRHCSAHTPPILLLYGNRDGAHHAFAERLRVLAARLPCLQLVVVYSRPRDRDVQGRDYQHQGHVGAHLVPQGWIERQARFYVCGPEGMLRDVQSGLLAGGAHRFAIFSERFQAPPTAQPPSDGPFSVTFARSGVTRSWTRAAGSLLNLAAGHGLTLPSGCRIGQCESCLVRVRSGAVAHLASVDLAEPGCCLACVAVPTTDLVLDA